ncbi:hypothetical protein CMUST_08705 [Corynebacterium mustelae]|uniref:Uncharacterized protein n=1 Tax=Corynebacterium mustelae TaxID=571915 RepID=A0A0G3GZU6_9CORY|nr:hypothetical protein CMUST_08705 [Corynebacterium mustelae]
MPSPWQAIPSTSSTTNRKALSPFTVHVTMQCKLETPNTLSGSWITRRIRQSHVKKLAEGTESHRKIPLFSLQNSSSFVIVVPGLFLKIQT